MVESPRRLEGIEKRKRYRVKGNSVYFLRKYGTSNPVWTSELPDTEAWPGGWEVQRGNPACMLFAVRSASENIYPSDVWYGHIGNLGELVDISELEEIQGEA